MRATRHLSGHTARFFPAYSAWWEMTSLRTTQTLLTWRSNVESRWRLCVPKVTLTLSTLTSTERFRSLARKRPTWLPKSVSSNIIGSHYACSFQKHIKARRFSAQVPSRRPAQGCTSLFGGSAFLRLLRFPVRRSDKLHYAVDCFVRREQAARLYAALRLCEVTSAAGKNSLILPCTT